MTIDRSSGGRVMRFRIFVVGFFSALLLMGCGSIARKPAVPEDVTGKAIVPGMPDVRYRVGIGTAALREDAIASFWREMDLLKTQGHTGSLPPANFLVISVKSTFTDSCRPLKV